MNLYHTWKLFLVIILHSQVGIATNFAPEGDAWNPDPYAACLHRNLRETDLIVAHPTLPCGSRVFLYAPRTRRGVVARIGDRGPRHALVDLNIPVTRALRANGWETILMIPRLKEGNK